ncbi:ABC transporter substrate-binding protein [Anaerosporobacter sp.]|uniref:ABC transporter substrate-binding protein n=1 Tax=Anaerosporobacter sp. TaxID=1872529 RepID=UPI00286F0337|nr:extracellular solute-binding protein [Anaerosporobacter sp.]
MKKKLKKIMALVLAGVMMFSATACGSKKGTNENTASGTTVSEDTSKDSKGTSETTKDDKPVVIKITWWGGQTRHDQTQQILDLYTKEHPNVTFEALPSGWDGYFEKLSTQAASGSMPDIVQMDYLYITTYAKNGTLTDMQQFIDDGTIDVSNIDEKLLNSAKIDNKMSGLVLSNSLLCVGYNPDVLTEAGLEAPTSDWKWNDFISMVNTIYEKTGKQGAAMGPVEDTNIFNYWVRQHGETLFSEDNKSLGYDDDAICAEYFQMWKDLMDNKSFPNPDEWAQIQTLGQEAGPVTTGDSAFTVEWNNYAAKLSAINDKLKIVTPPLSNDSEDKGLWIKPGMFFSVAETSKVKKEAAEFINWFINSEEANDIIMAERGTPVSSEIRNYMVGSGNLNAQQIDMFNYVDQAVALSGVTPLPDPIGMSEINEAFKNAANSAFYGQSTPEQAAANFRNEANEILERNNQ